MAMTVAEIQDAFKIYGKLIHVKGLAEAQVTAYKTASMGLVDQGSSGSSTEYDLYHNVIKGAVANIDSTVATVGKVPAQVETVIKTHLQKVVAPLLGTETSSSASPATILTNLITDMDTPDEGAGSAQTLDFGGNFAAYFSDTWGVDLPTDNAGAETIDEGWISATPV